GAYIARWIAKNLVAAKIADEIEIQFSYTIGNEYPELINITSVKNAKLPNTKIIEVIKKVFDLRLVSLISELDLQKPIYR
ncbi:methionine adenosyltransferase domain-containing protein, partial [Mesomycoplasma hyorhinis]